MPGRKQYRKRPLEGHTSDRMVQITTLLKEYRLWTGYTREEIEEEFGISRATLQRVESSDPKNITIRTIFELSDIYEVAPETLFQGVE
jgi:transcriptional regulator with XRE-family HTH domain